MNDHRDEPLGEEALAGPCEVPRAAAGRLAYLLVALGGKLSGFAQERFAPVGLDERDYSVLAILTVDGPGTQHEIARLLGKVPGVAVAAVDQLESKGYVERQRDPADRRRTRVTPTTAGSEALARADRIGDEIVAEALCGLTAAELGELRALLLKGLELDGK